MHHVCPRWACVAVRVCPPPYRIEVRVLLCVWSWAGWVSRPSQMNRGWEEAWRGCRGWEARALPKKLLLWDLCTFAFLTKHSALLERQSSQGGRHSQSQRSAWSCPLCFSSDILPFRLQFLHFQGAPLFSPASLNHLLIFFFDNVTDYDKILQN